MKDQTKLLKDYINKLSNTNLKLKESEKKFRGFVDTASDLMCITDKEGNFTDVNKAMVDTLGYSKKELLGMNISQILSKKSAEKDLKPNWKKFIRDGKIHIETTCLAKNGKEILSEIKAVAIYDNGRFAGTRAVINNLTERKKAEKAIHESEEKYKATFENTGTAMIIVENNTTIYLANHQFELLTGYSKEEIEGKMRWTKLVHKEDLERMKKYHKKRRKLKGEVPKHYEFLLVDKKGNLKNILVAIDIIPGTKKSIASLMDITALKNADETLRTEATRRRILMEQSRDGIVVLKQDGSVYESNQQFAKMIGFSLEEVSHLYVWDWEFQFTREQVQGMLRNVDETGDHFETKHRRKDGTIYDVEISTNAAVFAGEKLIFCVCRDITNQKKAEEDLRKRNEELEKFNRLTVGRELKMVELKKEIKKLKINKKNENQS